MLNQAIRAPPVRTFSCRLCLRGGGVDVFAHSFLERLGFLLLLGLLQVHISLLRLLLLLLRLLFPLCCDLKSNSGVNPPPPSL